MNIENMKNEHKSTLNNSMDINHVHQMNTESQYQSSSYEDSHCSHDNTEDIVEFGPIKVKPRRKPAPTLSTGRRSKYEILTPDEDQKRDVRRSRNRAAAERVRINRLNIEQQLQNQINQLEIQEKQLHHVIQMLQNQKVHLQSRVFTHERVCLSIQTNLTTTSSPCLSTPLVQTFKETTQINNNNTLDDLFFETLTLPVQNNDIDLLANMSPDDIEDYLINP